MAGVLIQNSASGRVAVSDILMNRIGEWEKALEEVDSACAVVRRAVLRRVVERRERKARSQDGRRRTPCQRPISSADGAGV